MCDFIAEPPALVRNNIDIAGLIVTLIEVIIINKVEEIELPNLALKRRVDRRLVTDRPG